MARPKSEPIHRGPRSPVLRYGGMGCAVLIVALIAFVSYAWWDLRRDLEHPPITASETNILHQKISYLQAKAGLSLPAFKSYENLPYTLADIQSAHPDHGRPVFFITAREINHALSLVPETTDRAEVRFATDQLNLRVKVPVPKDVPGIGGGDINVKARVRLQTSPPGLFVERVRAAGIPVPAQFVDQFVGKNLLDGTTIPATERALLKRTIGDARLTSEGLWIDLEAL